MTGALRLYTSTWLLEVHALRIGAAFIPCAWQFAAWICCATFIVTGVTWLGWGANSMTHCAYCAGQFRDKNGGALVSVSQAMTTPANSTK